MDNSPPLRVVTTSQIVAEYGGDGSLRASDRMPDVSVRNHDQQISVLADWTDGKHLVVLLNARTEEQAAVSKSLPNLRIESITTARLDEGGRKLLGTEGKILVLRADGYVGFRDGFDHLRELDAYAQQNGLR